MPSNMVQASFVHFFWRGKGWVVAIITFACCLLTQLSVEAVTKDSTFYLKNPYPIPAAFFIASLFTFYFNHLLIRQESKLPFGKIKPKHSLYFIPVKYWSWVLFACSVGILIFRSIKV